MLSIYATNWANDLRTSHLLFWEEHELTGNFPEDNSEVSEPDEAVLYMIYTRDSLLQFDLMTREEDYERITEDMNTKRGKSRVLKH